MLQRHPPGQVSSAFAATLFMREPYEEDVSVGVGRHAQTSDN